MSTSRSRRSTTGCGLCKTRRKKCDETKPQCLRCIASGKPCSYDYIEYPESEAHRVKRTKPAPRSTRVLATGSQNITDSFRDLTIAPLFMHSDSGDSGVLNRSVPFERYGNESQPSPEFSVPRGAVDPLSPPPATSLTLQPPPGITIGLASSSLPSWDLIRAPTFWSVYDPVPVAGSASNELQGCDQDPDNDNDNDNDPQEIQATLCRFLTVDKNVKENSLPFVLHCYFEWTLIDVFEPLKIAYTMREQVIAQFASENTRTRAILIANVMEMFAKNFKIDGARKSILSRLDSGVQKSGAAFMAAPPSALPALDRQNAIRILDNMLEIIGLQLDTYSTLDFMQSLEDAVPIFRRACLEPLGRPINLPNLLLDLSLNLRHFAVIDIITSLTTGLPARCQYEAPFSLELCEQIYHWQQQGNYGLQWLYGLPDQYLLLFAWINNMSETLGLGDNIELVASIERLIPQVKLSIGQPGDPSLHIAKMVVLQAWRYTALIYLYMVLCKASADDPRVMRAQKGFMRLVRTVRPGRYPDVFLIVSLVMAGVATTGERDQDTIRQRILSVREYAERGTVGNDALLRLEEVWARTRDEGRGAVWADLKIAYFRLTGR